VKEFSVFERAVICTDLSPSSESIVACAGALGVLGVQEAVLTHVVDIEHAEAMAFDAEASAIFSRQAEQIEQAGIQVHIDTNVGFPPYAIEEIAEKHAAGLIVIGSRGKGLFVAAFSGSVQGLGTVDVLHVVDNTTANSVDSRRCDARDRLAEISEALLDAGAGQVRVEVVVGAPDRETAKRAKTRGYSMTVMAPRLEESMEHPLGGVTHAVVRAATSPVLLIPPGCVR